jgi:hypothetical protein
MNNYLTIESTPAHVVNNYIDNNVIFVNNIDNDINSI